MICDKIDSPILRIRITLKVNMNYELGHDVQHDGPQLEYSVRM